MGFLAKKISESSSAHPATAVVRNYLNSSTVYATRTAEWGHKGVWSIQLDLFNTSVTPKVRCFSAMGRGVKNNVLEECYQKTANWLDDNFFVTQGLDEGNDVQDNVNVVKPEEIDTSSVAENVIITGAADSGIVPADKPTINSLLNWSSTEKYYEFMENSSGVMNRWFPLDAVQITTNDNPQINGGLKQIWKIPGDIFVNSFDSINVLPVRGFVLGKYELEFKITLQANPFQACCVMLSQCPNDYGLNTFESITALNMNGTLEPTNLTQSYSDETTYNDYRVAIQRPHVLIDVSSGGEATMTFSQKYHKTLLRNFDYSFVPEVNPGIQGSYYGTIALHVISPLRVGTGSPPHFNVRIFYRFVQAKLTGMSSTAVKTVPGNLLPLRSIPFARLPEATKKLQAAAAKMRSRGRDDHTDYHARAVHEISSWKTQGPVMSVINTARGVVDVADKALHVVEDFGTPTRKGFNVRNRDKPNDTVHVLKVIPRPRTNFMNGEGIDDALVMGLSWVELTQFFEVFDNEPQSIKDFINKTGYLGAFEWSTDQVSNTNLFEWNVHPTIAPGTPTNVLNGNHLMAPLSIASSFYTNYFGTMELYFQFIKTQYHKGSVEVAIHFGRSITGSGLSSSYVKVLNVQDCNGFSVTIPYIYDTAVRNIAGTSTPMVTPPIYSDELYQFAHSAKVNVKVVNELVAPDSVYKGIDVIVWIKGGSDFGLNFPRACNTVSIPTAKGLTTLPAHTREVFSSPDPQPQCYYTPNGVSQVASYMKGFYTQGDDESPDFHQPEYEGNRNTNIEHLNFKTIMKMPIKLVNNFKLTPTAQQEVVIVNGSIPGSKKMFSVKNYFTLPVTVMNSTLLQYLNTFAYSRTNAFGGFNMALNQSLPNQISQMFSMFRGSIVYTIVLTNGQNANISYLPHDYRLRPISGPLNESSNLYSMGDLKNSQIPSWNLMDSNGLTDVGSCLPYTTFMNSVVNPSEKVIVPMSNPNNWILLNRALPGSSGLNTKITTMRESLEWFNGHLLVWSNEEITFDVYANCGDDFEFGGFLGHTGTTNPYSLFALKDNWRTQGMPDFPIKELTRTGWNSLKTMCLGGLGAVTFGLATKTMLEFQQPAIASITGAIVIYSVVGGIEQVQRLRSLVRTGTDQVDNIQKIAGEVCEVGVETIVTLLKVQFPFLQNMNSIGKTVWSMAQHIIHSVLSMNWKNVAFGFFCVLIETKIFDIHDWPLLKDKLTNLITAACPATQTFVVQSDNVAELGESLMQLIATMICAKLQIKGTGGLKWYFKEMFAWQNYKHVSGLNNVLQLAKTLFRSVSNVFMWLFTKADPNVALLKALSAQDEEILEFLEESNLYLNNFNDNDFKRRDNRIRFLKTIMRAFKLRLVLLKIANPRLTGQLLQVCNKVVDKAQKQRYLFKCDVVKTEPFVLCIEGGTNVGKSFAVTDVVSSMLQSINYKGSSEDVLFTVAAGVDYWNGYADQPAVVYDDWCNLRDEQTMRQHISQLYQLKTSAPFNVPRAELENKEQIASPQIVVLSTNVPFPSSSIFNCPAAVWRRRDMMVKITLKDGKDIKDYDEDQLHRFDHIQVQIYGNVSEPSSLAPEIISYTDFLQILNSRFKEFHMRELRNKQFKYDILAKNVVKTKVDQLNLQNPFELLDQLTIESEDLMSSEVLEKEVERLMQLIHETVELSNQEPADSDVFITEGWLGDCKRMIVSRATNIQELAREYFQKTQNAIMLCGHCHGTASKYGTTFWCENHNHYLCFHCGVQGGRLLINEEDRFGNIKYKDDGHQKFCETFRCLMDGSALAIKQEPFFKAFIAEMIANRVQCFLDLWQGLRIWTGGQITTQRSLFGFLKCVEAYVTMAWGKIFRRMAAATFGVQSEMSMPVHTTPYTKLDKWTKEKDFSIYWDQVSHTSKTRYVCPHSLLEREYGYCEGEFTVLLEEESVTIPDKICASGKCVLLNLAYLERIKRKLLISPEYIEAYHACKAPVIGRYFPRFLWPSNFERLMDQRNMFKKMFDLNWWEHYMSPLGEKVTLWLKRVCPLLLGAGLLWASVKMYKHLWKIIGKIFGVDLLSEGLEQSSGEKSRRSKGRTRGKRSTPYTTQAVTENFENKLNKISSNYIIVRCGKSLFTAWGLCNSTFLMPKHLLCKLNRDPNIQIMYVSRAGEFQLTKDNLKITEYDNKDLAKVEVLGQKIMFKDCSKFLQERGKFSLENLTKGVFMDVDVVDELIYDLDVQLLNIAHNTMAADPGGCNYLTDVGVMYNYQRTGACGSLICADSVRPVLAMHISGAGSIQKGIGVVLFQDDYIIQGAPEVDDTGDATPYFGEECHIVYEGAVEKTLVPFIPKKSQIIPSLIADICDHPPLTQPAILDKTDPRYSHSHSPLYHGVVKNGKPTIDFPNALLNKAYLGLRDVLLSGQLLRKPTVLSVDEAVLGFPQMAVEDPYMDDESQYYGAMPLDTSAGWPYATNKYQVEYGIKTTSKSGWITYQRDSSGFPTGCTIHPKVISDHQEKMQIRSGGLPAINVFQDCLKDERRPLGKLLKPGGTRLFSMSNVEGTIALRRYTLDLTSHLRKNRLNNFIAVGINPESTEWTVLANMLLTKGNNIFTTDFTNFGAGLNYYCGMKFADLIKDFFLDKGGMEVNPLIIEALIVELMGSRHIVQNLIYKTQCGSPSGAAITVEMNSFVHMLYIMLSWLIIGEIYGKISTSGNLYARDCNVEYIDLENYLKALHLPKLSFTVDDFYANVVACVYGDDGIFSVTDEYKEIFNSVTINLVLKEHRIGVTDASKSEQIVKYGVLSDATFLKRNFVPNELHNLLFAAKISWQTVEECVRWIHKTPLTPEEATRENCEASLLLAWGHGKQKYDWWLSQINQSLKRVKLRPIILTWTDIGKKYYNDIVIS